MTKGEPRGGEAIGGGAPPQKDEPIDGVSLETFARVTVALDEGFPLADVARSTGLDPGSWESARAGWLARLGGAAGTELFSRYQDLVHRAEDDLSRDVSPVRSDLGAWLALLAAYGKAADPFAWLGSVGLRSRDVSRLSRAWGQRFSADPKLEAKAAELRAAGVGPLPPLTIGSAALPWKPSATPPGASSAAPKEKPPEPANLLSIERYARVRAGLAAGHDLDALLGRVRADERAYRDADAYYRVAAELDAALGGDLRMLVAHYEKVAEPRSQPRPSPPQPSEPRPALPPPAVPQPAAVPLLAQTMPSGGVAPVRPPPSPPAARPNSGAGLDTPQSAAVLPETAEIKTPIRTGPALPFSPVVASAPNPGPAASPSSPTSGPTSRRRRDRLPTGTAEIATPVRESAPTPSSKPQGASTASSISWPAMPAPRSIPGRREGGPPRPLLALEQHAAMHAELRAGHDRAFVLARYQLREEHAREVDEYYRYLFVADPAAYDRWHQVHGACSRALSPSGAR